MKKRFSLLIFFYFLLASVFLAFFFIRYRKNFPKVESPNLRKSNLREEKLKNTSPEKQAKEDDINLYASTVIFNQASSTDSAVITPRDILLNIPFTVQAPSANWKDPRQQDSCEEASVLMAMKWAKGETLNSAKAEEELLAMSDWELKNYNNFHDTSAEDTVARLIKEFLQYDHAEVKKNITMDDLKNEIFEGHALIIPMDGQKLKNPYYTSPGPERHMLVVRGYDTKTKEFITNDPGTRRGKEYRYPEDHFYDSIRDYPTGDHLPIKDIEKNIIVIRKS